MKKTLYLYIFREIPPPFLIGMATFTFMLLMGRFLKLAEMVVEKGVPLSDVLRMVAYLLPSFWLYTIPMALLLATLLAFGRLSGDSEVTAMKSCGISLYGMLPPPIVFALICCVLCSWITIYAVPWGNLAFKKLIIEVAQNKAGVVLKERVFNDAFPGLVIYTEKFDPKRQTMEGVIINDERNPKDPSTIFAKGGALVADPGERSIEFHLKDGSIHRSSGKEGYRLVEFQGYDLRVSLAQEDKQAEKSESEMTLDELRHPPKGRSAKDVMSMRLEYYSRLALPFSCFVFTLLAMPLGIQNRRSGKAAGFSVSIGVLLLYYIALSGFKTMGERGVISPALACWAPNIVFLVLGAYLFRKAAVEEELPLAAPIGQALRAVKRMMARGGRG
ncbi:LPS export ABC transporter permease LptF [Geomesophilobacter sediminis]|uniref:LPS export ABC transporter permease LptF n=1 Tax=Geomesophilobacter sediminis TaxID=2798584 RepID=A0A8J7M1Q1_9BACT|nr:LPS export ABC transporter permease LptF [Geomesophilobacter sediminis]MBJ6727066.1 LPS export ABC transporter permease LptF [Geomesophilobacter sediminis]